MKIWPENRISLLSSVQDLGKEEIIAIRTLIEPIGAALDEPVWLSDNVKLIMLIYLGESTISRDSVLLRVTFELNNDASVLVLSLEEFAPRKQMSVNEGHFLLPSDAKKILDDLCVRIRTALDHMFY
ncbi:MAG TPA: hypothetical protein VFT87_02625 [Candidatus Saccharimonadales bacterium]|nr:hypothetical protein [Candidatus Saccharimonadales bacterium]